MCDNIISNSRFDNVSNNYGYSEIRSWLNNDFLSLAFTKQEQEIIQTNFVLNSNHYNVSNHNIKYLDVEDKIFLLSEEELNNDTYELTSDNSRKILTTDYSRAKGAWNLMKNWYDEPYGSWWLRCPYAQATDYIRIVTYNDFKQLSIYNEKITSTQHGIVPALKIKI